MRFVRSKVMFYHTLACRDIKPALLSFSLRVSSERGGALAWYALGYSKMRDREARGFTATRRPVVAAHAHALFFYSDPLTTMRFKSC